MSVVKLAAPPDLPPGKTMKFEVRRGERTEEGFLLKVGGRLKAFRNRCPHIGTPLDYGDNEFFTDDNRYLICRTHSAMFEPANGFCVAGPCAGDKLDECPVAINADGTVSITADWKDE
jgi:nitrite reductase/ring-hydroxylating ferredoxin subunit